MALADFLKRDCMARACHPAELGDASSVWKGRSHQFCSSHPHTRTPSSHPGYRHRDLLPRKEGLSFGPPFRGSYPRPIATASRDARSLQLLASAGAPGTPTAVLAPCLECCQPEGWGRPEYLQAEGGRTLPPLDLFSWILQPGQGGVEPNEVSDHSSAGTESLQNRQTHGHCSRHCLLGAKPLDMQNLTFPVWHMVF